MDEDYYILAGEEMWADHLQFLYNIDYKDYEKDGHKLLLVIWNESPVGYITITPSDYKCRFSTCKEDHKWCDLEKVFIVEEHRRKRLAHYLLDNACKSAVELGYDTMHLELDSKQEDLLLWTHAMGLGEVSKDVFKDEGTEIIHFTCSVGEVK